MEGTPRSSALTLNVHCFSAILFSMGLVNIDNKDDISLYSQIETALQNGVNIGVLSMICALEQFQTLAEFNRNSKGITDVIAYLPFMTVEIADEAFRKTSTINQ